MSADYYLACTQCKVCFWVWWRNAGAACGPADVDAAALQAFVDAHLGHTITLIGDDDALDMDDQTARPERQPQEQVMPGRWLYDRLVIGAVLFVLGTLLACVLGR